MDDSINKSGNVSINYLKPILKKRELKKTDTLESHYELFNNNNTNTNSNDITIVDFIKD